MFKKILNEDQLKLLDLLKLFNKDFFLVWWTAIALKLWHRKSIYFDLFCTKPIKHQNIINTIKKNWFKIENTLVKNSDELTILVNWVKITFLYYPFFIKSENYIIENIIKSPDLLTLSTMKAYAMWRRSKWKDYVDIYFLVKSSISINDISKKAKEIFDWAFEEKLFREQLCYFDDIDYSEEVEYISEPTEQKEIENFLCKIAITY